MNPEEGEGEQLAAEVDSGVEGNTVQVRVGVGVGVRVFVAAVIAQV